jgi:hypothetical protein
MTQAVTPYVPLRERINLRIVIFVGVFAMLLGLPIYWYIDSAISGGIKQRGDFLAVDLKAMSTFVFDQTGGSIDDVPDKWRALDGKRVILEGEVTPAGFTARGLDRHFELVYSVAKCCFSGPPQIQHFVQINVPPEVDIGYRGGPVEVRGVLTVDVTRDPDSSRVTGIYHVKAESVRPVG